MRKEITVILIILALATTCIGSIAFIIYSTSGTYKITNIASMIAIDFDVTWDITGTQSCTEVNWGTLKPGSNKSITLYIRNTGSAKLSGSFNTTDWIPVIASNYITLTWNFGEAPLYPNRIRTTIFTLSISPDIMNITDFSFSIIITGTQV